MITDFNFTFCRPCGETAGETAGDTAGETAGDTVGFCEFNWV